MSEREGESEGHMASAVVYTRTSPSWTMLVVAAASSQSCTICVCVGASNVNDESYLASAPSTGAKKVPASTAISWLLGG